MKVKFQLLLYICLALLPLCVAASNPYEDYIARYSSLAVEHQSEYGIPASITLAQGLLESAAGRSTLASEGNNHFGIKCHKEWKGGEDASQRRRARRMFPRIQHARGEFSRPLPFSASHALSEAV